jgi:3-oxoacyl-[acyl-carrier-protein] synthase II
VNRVVITGAGITSSLGLDLDTYGRKLLDGHLAIEPAPWAEPEQPTAWVSPVRGFDALDWMDARVADGSDVFTHYAMAATVQALDDAGIAEPDPLRTAVVLGTSMAGVKSLVGAQRALDEGGPEAVPRKVHIQAWANMAAGQVALRWGLHGPLLSVCTACASSLDAIGIAARMIETGMADVAIAGGAESAMIPALFYSELAYGMCVAEHDPARVSMPFDVNRRGLLEGEGAGIVVLERDDHARRRGARPRGQVRGYASLADSHHPSSPEPSGQWEALTMRNALAEAALPGGSRDVDAIVAHGTGTQVGDSAEIRAINTVFGDDDEPPLVTSIKGHIGHTGGAAGVMALVGALRAAEEGAFMPTVGCNDVDPEARFPIVTGRARPLELRALQVNSFGFGGQDASLVVTFDGEGRTR